MADAKPETTYEITTSTTGTFQFTVPSNWKVTYGLLHPGTKGAFQDPASGYTLRFYEAQDKQRAVFQNVISFRDISIPYRQVNNNRGPRAPESKRKRRH